MKPDKELCEIAYTLENLDIVNSNELISDYSFLYRLSKRNSILDIDVVNFDLNKSHNGLPD